MKEVEIVNGCKQGDCRAQRCLYDLYAPRLMSVVVRYVNNRDIAKDIFQEAMVKIYQSILRFQWRGAGSLLAWMERIAVNEALNEIRNNSKMRFQEDIEVAEDVAVSGDEVESISVNKLMEFIAELPQGYRMIFNMYCIDGYSHAEIAQELGIKEKSSSSQLARAKVLLAKKIKNYLSDEVNG